MGLYGLLYLYSSMGSCRYLHPSALTYFFAAELGMVGTVPVPCVINGVLPIMGLHGIFYLHPSALTCFLAAELGMVGTVPVPSVFNDVLPIMGLHGLLYLHPSALTYFFAA